MPSFESILSELDDMFGASQQRRGYLPVADKFNPLARQLNPLATTEGARVYFGGGGQNYLRAYHGSSTGPVNPGERFRIPESSERGVFFTPDATIASSYSGQYGGGKVFPVRLDTKNSAVIDFAKIAGKPVEYKSKFVQAAIDGAVKNNKDFVILRNMKDVGGTADQIIAVRGSGKVRNAITDEIMLGLAGGVAIAPGVLDDD